MPIQKNAVLPLVVAGGLVAAVAVAVAGSGDDDPEPRKVAEAEAGDEAEADGAEIPARHKSILCRKLKCTVEQDEPVYQLIMAHREEAKARAKDIKTARRKIAELYSADEIDEEAMRGVYGEIADAEAKVQLQAYESIVTLHSLLSPEQRASLGRMLARVPPAEVLAKPGGGDKGRRDKGRGGRRGAAAELDPDARAARVKAARERRAAALRGGEAPAKLDPAARRRSADAGDDGGLH